MTEQPETPDPSSSDKRPSGTGFGMVFLTIAILLLSAGFVYGFFELSRVNIQLKGALQKRGAANGEQDIAGLQQSVNKSHVVQAQTLIKMANDQLQFTHNISYAMQLLQQADKELQFSQDPILLEVRKSVAADLANLQAQPSVDVTSIFLRLNALNDLIDKLPLPVQPLSADQQKINPDISVSGWKAGLNSFWKGLNKIVIIRKTDSSALPLVMPEEKMFLYQNLHAQLENAIFGLLHGNAAIYTASLARAMTWVKQYFVQGDKATQMFLQELVELQKVNVQMPAMTLSNTLKLFDGEKAQEKALQ